MFYNKVEICGVNTSKLPILTEEEKKDLLIKSRNGDKNARQTLINCNLRLVLSLVQKFSLRGENADDLFQIGCIGLIKAIDNFNTELDVMFSTYAVPMIIGEIRRYLRDNSLLKVSRSMRDLAYKALSARENLLKNTINEPSAKDICEYLKNNGEIFEERDVEEALESIMEPISLYDPIYSDNSSDSLYVMDQISDDENTEDNHIEEMVLNDSLMKLSERERNILLMRFYRGKNQMEVAYEIGISQAQVSRLEKSAITKIKKML